MADDSAALAPDRELRRAGHQPASSVQSESVSEFTIEIERTGEDEQHDEHDQRQVLVGVPVDLGGAWRKGEREHPRAVEAGDRDQVEDHEREVRQQERECGEARARR